MARQPASRQSERRDALLDAAVTEIARRGTRGMRVEEVAKRAGVSTALIYHHFGDRSSILQAALEHVGSIVEEYTNTDGLSGRETLLAVVEAEIQDDQRVRDASAAWGELRDAAIFDESLRPTLAAMLQRWIGDLAELIDAGQADGSIDPGVDSGEAAAALTASVEGVSPRWLAGVVDAVSARRLLRTMAEALIGGVPNAIPSLPSTERRR